MLYQLLVKKIISKYEIKINWKLYSSILIRLIGVAAVDSTVSEIENILTSHQWGDVYSFLINKYGEALYHPTLAVSANVHFYIYLLVFLSILLLHVHRG